jgi:hypothetical protein
VAWFSVDDALVDHKKVRRLGADRLTAMGLWVLCGSWAAAALTDGFVPADVVRRHDAAEKLAGRLVTVDLWERATMDGEPGYRYHDWTDYQPTAEQVAQRRRQRQEAGRRGGYAKAAKLASAIAPAMASAIAPAVAPAIASAVAPALANALANGLAKSCPLKEEKQKNQPPTGVGENLAFAMAPAIAPASAQTIMADWLDSCAHRPPGSVVGQIAKQVKTMLTEGIGPKFVLSGLLAWSRKDLHPSALPSLVNSVMNAHLAEYASPTDRNIAAFMSAGRPLRALPGGVDS